jgi:hypothetical protein
MRKTTAVDVLGCLFSEEGAFGNGWVTTQLTWSPIIARCAVVRILLTEY